MVSGGNRAGFERFWANPSRKSGKESTPGGSDSERFTVFDSGESERGGRFNSMESFLNSDFRGVSPDLAPQLLFSRAHTHAEQGLSATTGNAGT